MWSLRLTCGIVTPVAMAMALALGLYTGGVATTVKTPQTAEACPWCGAPGKTAWGTCLACGHYYLSKGWTTTPRSRHPYGG